MRRLSVILSLCLAAIVGCNGSDTKGKKAAKPEPRIDQNATVQPKFPDVYVGIKDPSGSGGGTIWGKRDDGYYLSSRAFGGRANGTNIMVSQIYDGTSEAGDAYIFEVKIDDKDPEIKKLVYEGKATEIKLIEGWKIILKPK